MKTVRFPIVKLIVGLGVGITGCFFLIYILDVWFNGTIADFLYSNFVGVNYYRTDTGSTYTTEYIILSRVYWAMLIVLLILVCGLVVTLCLVSYRQRKKQQTQTILEAGKLIRYLDSLFCSCLILQCHNSHNRLIIHSLFTAKLYIFLYFLVSLCRLLCLSLYLCFFCVFLSMSDFIAGWWWMQSRASLLFWCLPPSRFVLMPLIVSSAYLQVDRESSIPRHPGLFF